MVPPLLLQVQPHHRVLDMCLPHTHTPAHARTHTYAHHFLPTPRLDARPHALSPARTHSQAHTTSEYDVFGLLSRSLHTLAGVSCGEFGHRWCEVLACRCAAPGSKTLQLLEMLHAESTIPTGVVIANDIDMQVGFVVATQSHPFVECIPSAYVRKPPRRPDPTRHAGSADARAPVPVPARRTHWSPRYASAPASLPKLAI
jgi:hypothetical protein